MDDPLGVANRAYRSRLLVGTGKYKDFAPDASGDRCVEVRRSSPSRSGGPTSARIRASRSLLEYLAARRSSRILPNTAGCYSADDAVRTLRLARELLDGHTLVKLEVLGDPQVAVSRTCVETIERRARRW